MRSMLNFIGVRERKLKWVTTQVDLILTETAFCLPVSHFDNFGPRRMTKMA